MKTAILACLVACAGLLTGAGFSLWQSGQSGMSSVDGQWMTNPDIGSAEADGMLRARVARSGLFALTRNEAVYYVRSTDDSDARLDPACSYRLSGGALPASWWSVTLYDEAHFLARNTDDAASINADMPGLVADGWSALIGPDRPGSGDAWLSTSGAVSFDLTLRLYEPDLPALGLSAGAAFPALEKLSCPGEQS